MERSERVEKAFWEAAALPPGDRAAYLDAACGGDADLRREVERLLAAHDATGPNLVPRDPGGDHTRDGLIGSRLARYTIQRLIGEGGMGRVYEAIQDSPRRSVAIKVLHDWVRGERETRRFEDEGKALATLHHPGIAHVYEAGVFEHDGRGRPYLVMELVEEARVITEAGRGQGLRERLELAARVCEAVHHAHLRGIIHRDLKPANILVDGSGQPKVIDFGVARVIGAVDRTMRTQMGQLIGTPAYMSPEQCAGDTDDVDARTDVYSLGAILYEIVCGRRAFEMAGASDVLRMIVRQEPPAPSSVAARVPRTVDLMIRHAMAKDRDRRYQSAGEFAQDIRRYLAGESISISAPGAGRRIVDWAFRHPVIATAATCGAIAALSLAGTLAGVYVLALRPDHLVLDPERRFVGLESRAGQRLRTWEAEAGGTIVLDAMVDKPASMGAGRIILIGFEPRLTSAGAVGRVDAFDMSDPARRLWSTADWPLQPPDQYAERREAVPAIDLAVVEDVLEESPGPELVVVHSLNPFSPSAIRVFDLGGVLRYEAWHEGAIYSVWWLPTARRLLMCGLNCEARWDERGATGLRPCYPYFVAAIAPRFGRCGQRQWLVSRGRETDDTLLWYQWLGPSEHLGSLQDAGVSLLGPGLGWDQGRSATVVLRRPAFMGIELNLVIDSEGRTLTRWTNDGYKAAEREGKLPAPDVFQLLPYSSLPRPVP